MKTENDFNLASSSMMTQLMGMHMMAAHLHREAVDTFGENHETSDTAAMLKFTLYRAMCDANGGMPPRISIKQTA